MSETQIKMPLNHTVEADVEAALRKMSAQERSSLLYALQTIQSAPPPNAAKPEQAYRYHERNKPSRLIRTAAVVRDLTKPSGWAALVTAFGAKASDGALHIEEPPDAAKNKRGTVTGNLVPIDAVALATSPSRYRLLMDADGQWVGDDLPSTPSQA